MLYYLFRYLNELGVPGAGVFNYLSFRSAAAVITSLIIAVLIGKRLIYYLQRRQIGETIRNLDLEGQYRKQGTPSMGGIIIIASILVPVLLFARLDNVYIILMIITTVWVGLIGFLDDYIKIFKKNKEGLAGRFKIMGQVVLGVIVALTLYISDDVVVRVNVSAPAGVTVASADMSTDMYADVSAGFTGNVSESMSTDTSREVSANMSTDTSMEASANMSSMMSTDTSAEVKMSETFREYGPRGSREKSFRSPRQSTSNRPRPPSPLSRTMSSTIHGWFRLPRGRRSSCLDGWSSWRW